MKARAGAKPKAASASGGESRRARKMKGAPADLLERFRALCLALPEATEVEAWGHPTFRVRDKIFASIGGEGGEWSIGVKVTPELQSGLVDRDARFSIAKYVGKHGWISMRVDGPVEWREVSALVEESYRLIAPKALVARLPG